MQSPYALVWSVVTQNYLVVRSGLQFTLQYIHPDQQQSHDSNHGPVSKDLLFSNWLLMCLAGNYGDSDKSRPTEQCYLFRHIFNKGLYIKYLINKFSCLY